MNPSTTPPGSPATSSPDLAPGARTSFFDAAHDRLFVAVPKRGAQSAEIRVFEPHH